jgi:hypothetical protein
VCCHKVDDHGLGDNWSIWWTPCIAAAQRPRRVPRERPDSIWSIYVCCHKVDGHGLGDNWSIWWTPCIAAAQRPRRVPRERPDSVELMSTQGAPVVGADVGHILDVR